MAKLQMKRRKRNGLYVKERHEIYQIFWQKAKNPEALQQAHQWSLKKKERITRLAKLWNFLAHHSNKWIEIRADAIEALYATGATAYMIMRSAGLGRMINMVMEIEPTGLEHTYRYLERLFEETKVLKRCDNDFVKCVKEILYCGRDVKVYHNRVLSPGSFEPSPVCWLLRRRRWFSAVVLGHLVVSALSFSRGNVIDIAQRYLKPQSDWGTRLQIILVDAIMGRVGGPSYSLASSTISVEGQPGAGKSSYILNSVLGVLDLFKIYGDELARLGYSLEDVVSSFIFWDLDDFLPTMEYVVRKKTPIPVAIFEDASRIFTPYWIMLGKENIEKNAKIRNLLLTMRVAIANLIAVGNSPNDISSYLRRLITYRYTLEKPLIGLPISVIRDERGIAMEAWIDVLMWMPKQFFEIDEKIKNIVSLKTVKELKEIEKEAKEKAEKENE
jgi:hypothetical protein